MKPLEEVLHNWEVAIGLEVCTELTALKTKMFCGCSLDDGAEPNTHTCPVCLGLPGALPAPNKAAIEAALLVGLATHCAIEKKVMLYRKHSMHPAVPNSYQITQAFPAFCSRGYLEDKGGFRVGIAHICLEGNKGKVVPVGEKTRVEQDNSTHDSARCLIDYNRAGAPLLRLVTEPDLQTPEQACLFVQTLCEMYEGLGLLKTSTEKEFLCCSALVSLKPRGCTEASVAVKITNIHSVDDLRTALMYEVCRQAGMLERGEKSKKETRFWDANNQSTVAQEIAEFSENLRMYPDPDIAALTLSDDYIETLRARL